MEFIYESEFWVAVSFFIFIGVLVYFGVHTKVVSALDARCLSGGCSTEPPFQVSLSPNNACVRASACCASAGTRALPLPRAKA